MMHRASLFGCGVLLLVGCAKGNDSPTAKASSPGGITKGVTHDTTPKKPGASKTPPQVERRELTKPTAWFWRANLTKKKSKYTGPRLELSSNRVVVAGLDKATKRVGVFLQDDKGKTLATYLVPKHCPQGAASFAEHKGLVYVVTYNTASSGACVHALSKEDLTLTWVQRARALGPVEHSEYYNETQLLVHHDRLWISGRESGGVYTESRLLWKGALIGHQKVHAVFSDLSWPKNEVFKTSQAKHVTPAKTKGEDATFELLNSINTKSSDAVTTIKRVNATDGIQWQKQYTAKFMGRARMIECGDVVIVGRYSRIASGLMLEALDAKTGKSRWQKQAFGAGMVEHSKYSNQVELACDENAKQVIAYGNESEAKYIEHRDVKTGQILANTRFYP